jgi:hypothetical protein
VNLGNSRAYHSTHISLYYFSISLANLWQTYFFNVRSSVNCSILSLEYYSTRKDYTKKENLAIVKFISKYRFHNNVKGREMWQKAEAAQVCVPVVP